MKSDFKHIVKESLREAFYTPKKDKDILTESLFGQKLYIIIKDQFGLPLKIHALISKNTSHYHIYSTGYREEEYRLTWFNRDITEAKGHIDFPKKTLDYILRTKQLTPKSKQIFSNMYFCKPSEVKLEFVDTFNKPKEPINEALFGIRLKMKFPGSGIYPDRILKALISKNVKPKEKEYRLTWFNEDDGQPENHIDFDKQELEYILLNKKLSKNIGPSYIAKHSTEIDGYDEKDSSELIFEAFYTPKKVINESLYGKRIQLSWSGEKYDGLISKNTIPGELPFRFTWFHIDKSGNVLPDTHHDLTGKEVEFILKHNRFPYRIKRRFGTWGAPEIVSIKEDENYNDPYNEYGLDQELIEADKPNRLGLWWMRPNLKFFTALRNGSSDHELAALIELGRPHPSYPYRELFEHGYLRIVVNSTTIFFSTSTQISPTQVRRLYDICIEENKDLVFDTGGKNDKVIYQRKSNLHESLFLLEESCREIDLWNENRRN